MGDEGATMEKILADVRSKSGSSPEGEPSAMVATGVMIADGNGMSYGGACVYAWLCIACSCDRCELRAVIETDFATGRSVVSRKRENSRWFNLLI